MKPTDPLLTFGEVAALGGISIKTVRQLVNSGKLKALRFNARVLRVPLTEWTRCREQLATSSHN